MLIILCAWCFVLLLTAVLPWGRWLFITVTVLELVLATLVIMMMREALLPDYDDSPLGMFGGFVVLLFMASTALVLSVRYFYRYITKKA